MEYKSLFERYGDEILTDNSALNHFAQCKDCIFRDKTTVRGKECGWNKVYCFIYEEKYHMMKPDDIYENRAECEYYEKEKQRP